MSENLKSSKKGKGIVGFFLRHGPAQYKSYGEILKSENPSQNIKRESQEEDDLTPDGKVFARKEADKLLSGFNPSDDAVIFFSSEHMRALETAAIFKDAAKEKGIEVLNPGNVRGNVAQTIGAGEIRILENLSLERMDVLTDGVFYPEKGMPNINWAAVDAETKEKWEKAHAIVMQHDYGSWGANFYHHAEAVQSVFPHIKSSRQLHETKFKNMLRLLRFARDKEAKSGNTKKIRILAFGHENYVGAMLEEYFGEHGITNCEVLAFEENEEGKLMLTRRGEEKEIPY